MALSDCHNILLVRPSALGDVCRTTPVLASLRRAVPQARIDWVVQDSFVDAVAHHPAVNEVIGFPRARFGRWWRDAGSARELIGWVRDLRRRSYDLVIDAQGLGRSGLITRASGARRRIGPAQAREGAWLCYTQRVAVSHGVHAVDAMLALVDALGVEPVRDMRLYCSEADDAWWAQRRREIGVGDEPYCVLAPTARWASKRWPVDRWVGLAPAACERIGGRCVVIGSPPERAQVGDAFAECAGVIDLIGETSIGQTMAIIAGSALVIANDSAPLHMAVGFDRPCVGLFGPTDPAIVGPVGDRSTVVSSYSGEVHYRDRTLNDRLMREIQIDEVLAAADRVVGLGKGVVI